MNREEKKRLTRLNILVISEKMFSKQGIKKTDIRDIAKQSGVSTVTFYKYFPSKDELLTQITILKLTEASASIKEELEVSTDNILSIMKRIENLIDEKAGDLNNPEFDEFLDIAFFSNPKVILAQEEMTKDIVTAIYSQLKKTDQLKDNITLESMLFYVDMIIQYSRLPKNRNLFGPNHQRPHSNLEQEVFNIILYGFIKQSEKK